MSATVGMSSEERSRSSTKLQIAEERTNLRATTSSAASASSCTVNAPEGCLRLQPCATYAWIKYYNPQEDSRVLCTPITTHADHRNGFCLLIALRCSYVVF
jgi:hypothetical protein